MSATIITIIDQKYIEDMNAEHRACHGTYMQMREHAVNCGRMLLAIKDDLSHGDWEPWVEGNAEFSNRTARVYMQLAKAPDLPERQRSADLPTSIAGMLKEIREPKVKPEPKEDVGAALRALGSGTDTVPIVGEQIVPIDVVVAGYEQPAGGTWNDHQRRKADRIREQFDRIAIKITDALETTSLSRNGVLGILEGAAVDARQAYNDLEALKFSFE